jgi:hypothetical protein
MDEMDMRARGVTPILETEVPERKTTSLVKVLAAVGIFGAVTGLSYWDHQRTQPEREAEEKAYDERMQAHITGATAALEELVGKLNESEELQFTIANGVDSGYDLRGDLEVTYGVCRAGIPVFAEADMQVSATDRTYIWDREETGGKNNILAIVGENGNIFGYLALTPANILDSLPAECAK